jgi:O-antigen ligase
VLIKGWGLKKIDEYYLLVMELLIGVLLLSFPALMLTVKGGMNMALSASLLIALLVKLRSPAMLGPTEWKSEWTYYVVAMFAMTLAILISQTYHASFSARHYDGPSRYWLAIPFFLLLYRLDLRVFLTLQFAFPLAAMLGWALAIKASNGSTMPLIDKIRYGDSMLLFSMLSLLSIDWFGKDVWYLRALKLAGFVMGLLAAFQSGTRGALLAIPVFVVIYIYSRGSHLTARMTLRSLVLAVVVIGTSYLTNTVLQNRLQIMATDVATYSQGNLDTSAGVRWQLYGAAVEIISEHLVFGVGPGGYALQMAPMEDAGKVTALAAEYGRGEVHNDILKKTADLGIFGLVAILAVYLVPLWLFGKASRSSSSQIKRTGMMGMAFVSGFMIFGLTAEILNLTMTIAFYSFTVAVLLAYCYNTHHAEHGAIV